MILKNAIYPNYNLRPQPPFRIQDRIQTRDQSVRLSVPTQLFWVLKLKQVLPRPDIFVSAVAVNVSDSILVIGTEMVVELIKARSGRTLPSLKSDGDPFAQCAASEGNNRDNPKAMI